MRKINIISCIIAIIACIFTSCTTYKSYGYLQDIEKIKLENFSEKYEAKIKIDDRLRITVFGADAKVVAPYNLTIGDNVNNITNGTGNTYSYLVDNKGCITFPTLGELHVEGMTRRELEKYLTETIGKDVKNPTVLVNFEHYTVYVLGDIGGKAIELDHERVSIFEVLAKAGDLNIGSRRDNILLVREVDGKPTYKRINLKTAKTLSEEYYYLEQNDIIYIQPGPTSDITRTTTLWTSVISAITTVTTMVLLLTK